MTAVKLEDRPNDGGSEVHDDRKQSVGGKEACEWERKEPGAFTDAHDHDGRRNHEADAVDSHAPLQGRVTIIRDRVADEHEYDAGHEGLTNLKQAWNRGHVPGDFTWLRSRQTHFDEIRYGGQAGEDRGDDSEVSSLIAYHLALQEVEWENDGRRQAKKRSVAGKRNREVFPGQGGTSLETHDLHQQNQQGPGEAESPAEDAPVVHAVVDCPSVGRNAKRHTSEH